MRQELINKFFAKNGGYFNSQQRSIIKDKLEIVDEATLREIMFVKFRSPMAILIVAIIFPIGVDRFLTGDAGKGFLKTITFGGAGFWWIIDWFTAVKRTKAYNYKKIKKILFID